MVLHTPPHMEMDDGTEKRNDDNLEDVINKESGSFSSVSLLNLNSIH